MQNQSTTPGSMFSYILSHQTPAAMAWVRGGSAYPAISGLVKFYETPYQGYAWLSFYDKRFTIKDILGRSVVVHSGADDFHSQPSGNSGAKIACGVIRSE